MTRTYCNAAQVLPGKLLREVQQYCSGQVYIPKPENKAAQRRARVLAFAGEGLKTHEIARRLRLSRRHVQRILSTDRKSHALAQKKLNFSQ